MIHMNISIFHDINNNDKQHCRIPPIALVLRNIGPRLASLCSFVLTIDIGYQSLISAAGDRYQTYYATNKDGTPKEEKWLTLREKCYILRLGPESKCSN